jgi:hypothetical protein
MSYLEIRFAFRVPNHAKHISAVLEKALEILERQIEPPHSKE